MKLSFPTTRIGEPVESGRMTIIPLFTESPVNLDYALSSEAIAKGDIVVEEVNKSGSVNMLRVTNNSNLPVLLLEGEELMGAKQNRVLNTSVLVPKESSLLVPVSCVEQGRWSYESEKFRSSRHHSPSRLRHSLKKSVRHSLRSSMGHTSDQGDVWREVEMFQRELGVLSETKAQADTYAQYGRSLDQVREEIPYVKGATGVVAAVDGKLIALELFDRSKTLEKVWSRLLSGWYLDSLRKEKLKNTSISVEALYQMLHENEWTHEVAVGRGSEFRLAENKDNLEASALYFEDALLHGSAIFV